MKALVIQPGASYSTADVHNGIVRELEVLGHEIIRYNLDTRIARASSWLAFSYQEAIKSGFTVPEPTPGDTIFMACAESILTALRHMPDWVIVFSGMYMHPDVLIMMQRAFKGIGTKIAIVLTECPYDDANQFKIIPYGDVIFVNDKSSVEAFSEFHRAVHYLPHGYDPAIHNTDSTEDDADVPAHDVVFVGTGFRERIELLASIDWTGIDLGLYGTYDLLDEMPDEAAKLKPFIRGEVIDNSVAASLYRHAKIGLNLHRSSIGFGYDAPQIIGAYSMNPRLFELAADGCFILSDYRPEMGDVFGSLIPTFENSTQAEQLIRHWLKFNEGREAVSSLLTKAVASHTFTARAVQVTRALSAEGDAKWPDTTDERVSSTSRSLAPAPQAQSLR